MERIFLLLAAANGFLAVALGAFGAHGLKTWLADKEDGPQRLEWWEKAAHYHLTHALAITLAAYLLTKGPNTWARVSGWAFSVGILLFCGSLYVMTLNGVRGLGAVTPIGGLLFLLGWGAAFAAAFQMK